jgi:hypothetical protein
MEKLRFSHGKADLDSGLVFIEDQAYRKRNILMRIRSRKVQLKVFSGLICFLMAFHVDAQTENRFGVKGGINVSNLSVDNANEQNARIGYHAGLYGQIMSSETFALQLELLYSTKGSREQYSSGSLNQEINYNLGYIDLPVLGVFKLGRQAEIHVGGYASYLLNANVSYKGDLASGADDINKDNLKSYDYGLTGGFGFNFRKSVQVGARYNYGLVKIADSDSAKMILGNDAKNSVAQVYLAFNFSGR